MTLSQLEKARRIILKLEVLDRERGYELQPANAAPGEKLRMIDIDARRRGAIATGRVPATSTGWSSKAGRTLTIKSRPKASTAQVWEDGELVFAGQTIARKLRILHYIEGDWEQLFVQQDAAE